MQEKVPTLEAAVGSSVRQADSRFSGSSCRKNIMLSTFRKIGTKAVTGAIQFQNILNIKLHHLGAKMYHLVNYAPLAKNKVQRCTF